MQTQVTTKNICATLAYLIGVRESSLNLEYSDECLDLLNDLNENENAKILRILCDMRSIMLQKFSEVNAEIRYNLRNLDSIALFKDLDIKWLNEKTHIITANTTAQDYIIKICQLIHEYIPSCRELFPDWVEWRYIQSLFDIPGTFGTNKAKATKVLKEVSEQFNSKITCYPYQRYLNWNSKECGYLLKNDKKFLDIIYRQNGDIFEENGMVYDARKEIKTAIYDFIDDNEKIDIVIDCENSDVYKLYSVLDSLDSSKLEKINKIVLYDDYHTVNTWQLLEKLTELKVEYNEVERIMDSKSLVDVKMTAGVCKSFYNENVRAFILLSSDSDFWGLISSLPDVKFLVMIEYDKCSPAMTKMLYDHDIYYCSIDDFCKGNIDKLKNLALKKEILSVINGFNTQGVWEDRQIDSLTDSIFAKCRIDPTKNEKKNFIERYIKPLKLTISKTGWLEIELP